MNYVIVKTVRNSRNLFRGDAPITGMETRQKTMKSAEIQYTTMLLVITTLFLTLLFPTYVRFIYTAFVNSDTPNSGINFFLYCVSGRKFRNDVKEIVCDGRSSCLSVDTNTDTNCRKIIIFMKKEKK